MEKTHVGKQHMLDAYFLPFSHKYFKHTFILLLTTIYMPIVHAVQRSNFLGKQSGIVQCHMKFSAL